MATIMTHTHFLTDSRARFGAPFAWRRVVLALGVVWLTAVILALGPTAAEAAKKPQHAEKIDRALADVLDLDGGGPVRVIVRVVPGKKADVKAALARKQKGVAAEHDFIGALTTTVDVNDLADLADDANVASVSIDADVSASAIASTVTGSASNTA